MNEAIILAVIATVVPTLTVLMHWSAQNRQSTETKKDVAGVHEIVNSQRTEMLAAIEALKAEVARLQHSGGDTPTTQPGVTSPPVTIRDGNVTVSQPQDENSQP